MIVRIEILVNVAEDYTPDLGVLNDQIKKSIRVDKTNGVQPFAADGQGRVVQANEDMLTLACIEHPSQPLELLLTDFSCCSVRPAAVDTDDQPVSKLCVFAIVKRVALQGLLHFGPGVMVTGYAVNRQIERRHERTKLFVGSDAVVLNQVARHGYNICLPFGIPNMLKHPLQRLPGYSTAQARGRICKQMRVCNLQYPNWSVCLRDESVPAFYQSLVGTSSDNNPV